MMASRWQICWPPVSDTKEIRLTIWLGCFAAFFYAVQWGLLLIVDAIYAIVTSNSEIIPKALEGLLHFTISAVIGWGIYKKYKAAPIAGLILASYGFIGNLITKGIFNRSSIILFIDSWMFLQSMRGIFAFHKMNKEKTE
jgi:hypothetical protein